MKIIYTYLYFLLIISIQSCKIKESKQIQSLNECESNLDSLKYSKLKTGEIKNIDILNGIKCLEFNSDISKYQDFGKTTLLKNLSIIITNEEFLFKNILWKTEIIFDKEKLVGIVLKSDNIFTLNDTRSFYNDFKTLFGEKMNFTLSDINQSINNDFVYIMKYNTKDASWDNDLIKKMNNEIVYIIENENSPKNIYKEITDRNPHIASYKHSIITKDVSYIKRNGINGIEFEKVWYNYNLSFNCTWQSKNIFSIVFHRGNPFEIFSKEFSKTIDTFNSKISHSTEAFSDKYIYNPKYKIEIRYFTSSNYYKNYFDLLKDEQIEKNNLKLNKEKIQKDSIEKYKNEELKKSFL